MKAIQLIHHSIPAHSTESSRPFKVMCECPNRDPCGRLDSVKWNDGLVEWNGLLICWILLIGFHLLIKTNCQ